MQAPIINLDIEEDVVFSPKDYFNYKKNFEGKEIPLIPKKAIICFEPSFIEYCKTNKLIEEIKWFRTEFKLYKFISQDVLLVSVTYGAALSAIALEELIALDVNEFVVLGSAGTLQKNISLGSIIIAESAIREEGVSYHYLKPSKEVNASQKLLTKAKEVFEKIQTPSFSGTTWSTDSFYRETISKTKKYQEQGVLSVEMEAAALYSIAKFRKAEIVSLLYISDTIADLKWNPNFHSTNSQTTQKIMIEAALDILG